jgi:TIR domain
MGCLADLPELIGFFSYSREDDADSHGALSALRTRIQGESRGQLGRTAKTFRLWQDREAIASGTLWESEIKTAVAQSVFFIPIITPTVVASPYCKFELESFLAREAVIGRDNLVFPILYIDVPALDDPVRRQNDPILSLIARRQYVDWREFRHLDANATEVKRAVERFCAHIRDALHRPWISPEERTQQEAKQREAEERRLLRVFWESTVPRCMAGWHSIDVVDGGR